MFCVYWKLPLYFAGKVLVRVSLATCIFTCTILPLMVPTQPIIEALNLMFCLPDFSRWLFSEVLSCSFQSLLSILFRLISHNFPLVLYEKCVCVRVRAAKHRFGVKLKLKWSGETSSWTMHGSLGENLWSVLNETWLILVHENECRDSRYIFHLVGSSSFLILWKTLTERRCLAIYDGGWMKVDISQGVSLSTKGSKLAHREQWVVLKKKVTIYAVFMKIRLNRIPQATKSKQWKYALDAVCSRQTTHFPGTNITSLSWLCFMSSPLVSAQSILRLTHKYTTREDDKSF